MRKLTVPLLAVALPLGGLAVTSAVAATAPPGAVTAECTAESNTNIAYRFDNGDLAAQTFTPVKAGYLRSADIKTVQRFSGGVPADITVEVRTVASGLPTTTVLATATIPDAAIIEDPNWHDYTVVFPLASAPYLEDGTDYALVVTTPDTEVNMWRSQYQVACDGAQLYYNGTWNNSNNHYDGRYAVRVGPKNDAFSAAQTLDGHNLDVPGSTFGATRQTGEPDHYTTGSDANSWTGEHSVWYRWTALGSGPVTIDTCDSQIDSILAVYTGTKLDALTRVTDNNNDAACPASGWDWGSKVAFDAQAGTTYRIAVADAGGATQSTFNLELAGPQNEAPRITKIRPMDGSTISDRTPTIAATVRDSATNLAASNIVLRVDGEIRSGFSYDRSTDRLTYTTNRLDLGKHTVRIRAVDAQGLATVRDWSFRIA